MPTYLQKTSELYISKAPETAFNTPLVVAADFKRVMADNPAIALPDPNMVDNAGRAGSEFATTLCSTYWTTAAQVSGEADFDSMARLWRRAAGGPITTTILTAGVAFKHEAPLLPATSGTVLPSSTVVARIPGTEAAFLYAGMIVAQAQMSQNRVDLPRCQFDLVGSGKHNEGNSGSGVAGAVSSAFLTGGYAGLPGIPSFSCPRTFAYLSYTGGSSPDYSTTCRIRSWAVSLNNAIDPAGDRCPGDPTQIAGDYTVASGASEAAYNTTLTHGDRVVTAEFTILLDTSLAEWRQMAAKVALSNITFGTRGSILTGSTYESLKIIIPTGLFRQVSQVESEGKAAITMRLQPTGATNVMNVEVVNGIAAADFS